MKIQSFDLDLTASRCCTTTVSREITREFSFAQTLDTMAVSGQGLAAADFTTDRTPSSTDLFRLELMKMRQIMDALMERLTAFTRDGSRFSLGRASDIYALSMPRTSGMAAWEYTETRAMSYEVSEQTLVSAQGMVRTADSQDIDFVFDFSMERSFVQEEYFSQTRTGYTLVDPLIIEMDGAAPRLGGCKFSFDLDLDSEAEDLPLPGPGTGFLSLDLNNDGQINDGRELFGPTTGNGFEELAQHDLDRNNWIDENDPVFDRLTLWTPSDTGDFELTRIDDAGIGAIYLSSVASPFDLTSQDNDLLGRISKTSIALTEDGEVLPVQEMDYKV